MAREIRPTLCTCGMKLWDRHTPAEVCPGSFIVCIYCGQALQLNDELRGVPVRLEDAPDHLREQLTEMQMAARLVGPAFAAKLGRQRRQGN